MLEDPDSKLRRTRNRGDWADGVVYRRARFATFTAALLRDDESEIHSRGRAWETETLIEIANRTKDNTSQHAKAMVRKFRDFGKKRFDDARFPVVPPIPSLEEFLSAGPFARKGTVKRKVGQHKRSPLKTSNLAKTGPVVGNSSRLRSE